MTANKKMMYRILIAFSAALVCSSEVNFVRQSFFDTECTSKVDCQNITGSICADGQCACALGYKAIKVPSGESYCTSIQNKNLSCSTSTECQQFLNNTFCWFGSCSCTYGFNNRSLGNGNFECIKAPGYLEECSTMNPCSNTTGPLDCHRSRCLCPPFTSFEHGRCERKTFYEKRKDVPDEEISYRYNTFAVVTIVIIFVVAFGVLISNRSLFFYFPCCIKDPLLPTEMSLNPSSQYPSTYGLNDFHEVIMNRDHNDIRSPTPQEDDLPSYADLSKIDNAGELPKYEDAKCQNTLSRQQSSSIA